MGIPLTAEPLGTETETSADDGSAGPLLRQSDSTDSDRSDHSALECHKYNLLASEATELGRANTGAAGSKSGHGDTAD